MISIILLQLVLAGPTTYSPVHVWHVPARTANVDGVSFWSSEMGCVYQAKNMINGKKYIGKTVQGMKRRRSSHKKNAKKGCLFVFHRALRKHGFENFRWTVLFVSDDEDELNQMEKVMIKKRNTRVPNGYNLTDGGEGVFGWKHSLEARKRMSKSHLGHKVNLGRVQSLETKRKISKALSGRSLSPKTKQKISETLVGRKKPKFSEEHKRRISEAKKGKSSWNRGKRMGPLSEEHRRKVSEGVRRSLEKKKAE